MKIIHTFWTKGQAEPNAHFLDIKAGWIACEYHWMSWALSCLQARNFFDEVELVTDKLGKKILIDTLNLPYTNVRTDLEGKFEGYPPNIWAVAKIFSYGLQTQPFLHIDGDVFLFQKPGDDFLNAAIISQNLEKNFFFYKGTLDDINATFSFVPSIFKKEHYSEKDIYASNAGMVGGSDLAFFSLYTTEVLRFIEQNKNQLLQLKSLGELNFVFEQYALFQIAELEKKTTTYFIDKIIESPLFEDVAHFQDAPNIKIIHPVGGFKKNTQPCDFVAKYLRYKYPDFYYKILHTLANEKIKIVNKSYYLIIDNYFPEKDLNNNQSKNFERTIAAISKWITDKKDDNYEWLWSADEKEMKTFINAQPIDAIKKEIIEEIFYLENYKAQLPNQLFSDKLNCIAEYEKETTSYERYINLFSSGIEGVLNAKFELSKNIKLLNLSWNWKYDEYKQIDALLTDNLKEPKALHQVAFIPNFSRYEIDEYYLDESDMIVVDIIKEAGNIDINKLSEEIKCFFDEEEIKANPLGFQNLLIKTIKRLSNSNILEIASF